MITPKSILSPRNAIYCMKQAPISGSVAGAATAPAITRDTELLNAKQAAKKLNEKLTTYFNIIPRNSKMKKPIEFELFGKKYEFYVDRTHSENYAYIKEQEITDKSCEANKSDFMLFEMRFNDNRQLSNGAVYFIDGSGNNKCYRFTRGKSNTRLVEQTTTFQNGYAISQKFRPAPNSPGEWILVAKNSNLPKHGHYPYWNINGKTKNPILNLFYELSQTKSALLKSQK